MNPRLLSLLILSIFILGCTPELPATLEEVAAEEKNEDPATPEEGEPEEGEQEETEGDTAPYDNFTEGETKDLLGHTITVTKIYTTPQIDIEVDGFSTSIKETKTEEIIKGLKIAVQVFEYDYSATGNTFITLKIEELLLGENEYLVEKGAPVVVGDKEVYLDESRYDGAIYVSVYDKGEKTGDKEKIRSGETKEVYGLTITNTQNYFRVRHYAILEITEAASP